MSLIEIYVAVESLPMNIQLEKRKSIYRRLLFADDRMTELDELDVKCTDNIKPSVNQLKIL